MGRIGRVAVAFLTITGAYYLVSLSVADAMMSMALPRAGTVAVNTVVRLCFGLLAVAVARKLIGVEVPKTTARRMLDGMFAAGGAFWLYVALNVISAAETVDITYPPIKTAGLLVLEALYCLSIGFIEEASFRELLLGGLGKSMGGRRGAISALLISSAAFGVIHFVNLLAYPQLVYATLAQVAYSFILGFFLGAVYLRTRCLAAVAVMHGALDFAGDVWKLFSSASAVPTDAPPATAAATVAVCLPLLAAALWLVRKGERSPLF